MLLYILRPLVHKTTLSKQMKQIGEKIFTKKSDQKQKLTEPLESEPRHASSFPRALSKTHLPQPSIMQNDILRRIDAALGLLKLKNVKQTNF